MSTDTVADVKISLKYPSKYKVIFLNDDFTPMDYVIQLLREVFNKSSEEAHKLTMDVHEHGRGIAGVFSKEIAMHKVNECNTYSARFKYPLRVVAEKE